MALIKLIEKWAKSDLERDMPAVVAAHIMDM